MRGKAVTVYEKAGRGGGHRNTIDVLDGANSFPVDMGFMMYDESTCPDRSALFAKRVCAPVATMSGCGSWAVLNNLVVRETRPVEV